MKQIKCCRKCDRRYPGKGVNTDKTVYANLRRKNANEGTYKTGRRDGRQETQICLTTVG